MNFIAIGIGFVIGFIAGFTTMALMAMGGDD